MEMEKLMFNQMPMYYGTSQNNRMPSYYGNTGDTPNQMPYAYGMTNENPLPMQPSPISSLPPLFPSMLTPQLNPQAPFTSQNLMQARYAEGGSVRPQNLSQMAELIREEGDEDDSILAHINPEEAHELAHSHGMDVNPLTGLPQFGRFRRKLRHFTKKLIHKAVPVVGAVLGNTLLPGLGAPIGGALANVVRAKVEHKDPFKAAMRGMGVGAGLSYGLPLLGQGLSSLGATNLGAGLSAIGAGQYGQGLGAFQQAMGPSAGAMQGAPGAAAMKALSPAERFLQQAARQTAGMGARSLYPTGGLPSKESAFGDILGKGGLSNLLLPAALLGTAFRKEKMKPAYEQPSFENVQQMIGPQALRKMYGPEDMPNRFSPFTRKRLEAPELEEEMAGLKPYSYSPYFEGYSTGGQVARGGFITGHDGGQDDNVHRDLPENSFIINATAVSHLGDGNSLAGAKKLDHFFHHLKHQHGLSGYHMHGGGTAHRKIDAMVSDGEYEVSPEHVASLGKGDLHKGVKMLNNLQKNVLSHKATKKLPPKAKSLFVYMQKRSGR